MWGANKKPAKAGFTIIEVMIFLAISGLTFLIAASFINGKEAQAEFTQGMNNANATLRNLIDNVGNGNYPFPSNRFINCSLVMGVGGYRLQITPSAHSSIQPGCALIGSLFVPGGSNSSSYSVSALAGCQFYSGSSCSSTSDTPPSTLAEEQPTIVPEMTQQQNWPGGLNISGIWLVSQTAPAQSIGKLGFYSSLPEVNGSLLQNGAQQVEGVTYSSAGASLTSGSLLSNGEEVVMCFTGLGSNNYGSITIGAQAGGGQLITSVGLGKSRVQPC